MFDLLKKKKKAEFLLWRSLNLK